MTVTVVDVAIIVGCVALATAFIGGLFVGARLTRSAGGSTGDRKAASAEVGELVVQLLREVLDAVRELRSGQADSRELPAIHRKPRRRSRSGAKSKPKKEG
jgi:hypothetical protein